MIGQLCKNKSAQDDSRSHHPSLRVITSSHWKTLSFNGTHNPRTRRNVYSEASSLLATRSKKSSAQKKQFAGKLHNQIQELKGNIRVFCRVRPLVPMNLQMRINLRKSSFLMHRLRGVRLSVLRTKERVLMGKEIIKNYPFQFDKVFIAKKLGLY